MIATRTRSSSGEEEAVPSFEMEAYLDKPFQPSVLMENIQRVTAPQHSSPSGENVSTTVFDRIGFLHRLDGDEPLAQEIVAMFMHEYPRLLQDVRHAGEQRDAYKLERAAHALKGSLGDIAAPQAYDAARTLEQKARKGELECAGTLVTNLETAVERLALELRAVDGKIA